MAKQQKLSPTILKLQIEKEIFGARVELEHKFHDKRRWRIDLAVWLPNCKVAIEIEGGVFTKGRHINPKGFLNDIEKYNALTLYGWKLLRYTHVAHGYYNVIDDLKMLQE